MNLRLSALYKGGGGTSEVGRTFLALNSNCLQNQYATNSNANRDLTLKQTLLPSLLVVVETRYFTVDVPALFPIELVVIAAVAVGVTLAIVFVYRRRAKR